MNSTITRTSDDVARDRIETAWRDYPLCSDCGRPMTIEAHDGSLWVECTSLRELTGIRRLLTAGFHQRPDLEIPVARVAALAA